MAGEDLSRYVAEIELRVDSHYTDRVFEKSGGWPDSDRV